MRRLFLTACIVLLQAALGAPPVWAQANDGTVTGTVSNRSAGGQSAAGDLVHLYRFGVREQALLDEQQSRIQADGTFHFDSLDQDSNAAYFVVVEHDGVSYPHTPPFQIEDERSRKVEVDVYDTTTSAASIRLERVNLVILGTESGVLQVMQMGVLSNGGDRTYVTTNPQDGVFARGLRLALPSGALSARAQYGFRQEDIVASQDGVQVVSAVKPGPHEYALMFELPYSGTAADLSLRQSYPAESIRAYVPHPEVRLDSDTLALEKTSDMGGQTFAVYSAGNIGPQARVSARVEGLPSAGSPFQGPVPTIVALATTLALLVGGVGAYVVGRKRGRSTTYALHPREAPAVTERPLLLAHLAQLDLDYEAGNLSPEHYRRQRHDAKEKVLALARSLPSAG